MYFHYFFVFGDDSHCFFIKNLPRLFSYLSNVLLSVSLCNYSIDILNAFLLEMGGGHMGKSTYAMGVLSSVHVRTMGEGVTFLSFWCLCTNWMASSSE